MKTHTIIKHTAALLSAAVLLALPAHAVQNFNKTHTYSTGSSKFGAAASFYAYDDQIAPTGPGTGSYSITAGGNVTGKVLYGSVTALSGEGSVKAKPDGTGTFSGYLRALGYNLFNVSNAALPYVSQPYIKSWSASTEVDFWIYVIPCTVKATVTASVDARFRVDTSSSLLVGLPRIEMKIGPVADLAATAEGRVSAGFDGLASVAAGAIGKLRLGKAAITANVSVGPAIQVNTQGTLQAAPASGTPASGTPSPVAAFTAVNAMPVATFTAVNAMPVATFTPVNAVPAATLATAIPANVTAFGAVNITASLTASSSGIYGSLDVYAEGELWPFGKHREWKRIAEYTSGPLSTNLFGPVTYTWY